MKMKSSEIMIDIKDDIDWYLNSTDTIKTSIFYALFVMCISAPIFIYVNNENLFDSIKRSFFPGIVTFSLYMILTPICMVVFHLKMSELDKRVKWIISQETVTIENALGSRLVSRWDSIRKIKIKRKGVVVYYKPRGSKWIPLRALDSEQIAALREISQNR